MNEIIRLIEGNTIHNQVAIATMAFDRILHDAPAIDVGWARDTAMRIASIKPLRDSTAYANFCGQALRILSKKVPA